MKADTNTDFIDPASIYSPDFIEWLYLSPAERMARSGELWDMYITYGGTFEADLDPQSPFFDPEASAKSIADGRTGLRLIRRC